MLLNSRADLALLVCLQACGATGSFDADGLERTMWLELRAYRVSEATHARLVAPRPATLAVLLPRTTAPGELLPVPPPAPEPPPMSPAGVRIGVSIVDATATPQLHVMRHGPQASALVLDLDTLEPAELHRRSIGRLELTPSHGCATRIEQTVEYTEDFDIEVQSASITANPVVAEIRERIDLRCVFDRRDDGMIEFEFELADQAIQRPIETFSTTLGNAIPVTIQLPRVERMGIGARVALQQRDTLMCSWRSPNGEHSVMLLRAHAGRKD